MRGEERYQASPSGSARSRLPGVRHGEAPSLPHALVHHQLPEEARGAAGRQFRGGGPLPRQLRGLQLQVHVLLKGPDAGVRLRGGQLVGGGLPPRHVGQGGGWGCDAALGTPLGPDAMPFKASAGAELSTACLSPQAEQHLPLFPSLTAPGSPG